MNLAHNHCVADIPLACRYNGPASNVQSGIRGEKSVSESAGTNSSVTKPSITRKGTERSLQLALAAARTAADNKGRNIVLLDMREQTPLFDYFVIATGTSGRQLRAMSEDIDNVLEKDLKDKRRGISGFNESRWIVLDYGTVLIHLFDETTRKFYELENLWGDARQVELPVLAKDNL